MSVEGAKKFFSLLLGTPKTYYPGLETAQFICPFHTEKSASLFVNFDTGFWHCSSCKKKGDLFAFYKEFFQEKGDDAFEKFLAFCEKEEIKLSDLKITKNF